MQEKPEETKDIKKQDAERKAQEVAGGGFGGPAPETPAVETK